MTTLEKNLTRDEAIDYFNDSGLSYKNINELKIIELDKILNDELSKNDIEVNGVKSKAYVDQGNSLNLYDKDKLRCAFIRINGENFSSKQGISFNTDGKINIAEWANDENVQPFLRAFIKWCDTFK